MKSSSILKFLVAILILTTAVISRAVPGDEHWDVQFGWPGTGVNTVGIASHNGKLYACGAGKLTNLQLQVWDGTQWAVQAQVFGASSGTTVYDLKFVGDTLYLAGVFTNVNGVNAGGLAQWDGTTWSSVGGLNGFVTGLTVDGQNLYVSGVFTNPAAGGVVATNIAVWDGNTWHALGNGLGVVSGTSFGVRNSTIKNGLVYAAGLFTNSGPQLMTNVAVWDGNTWSALNGGGVNGLATTLTFFGNDLYVGGVFSQAGSTPVSMLARWDGANWFILGAGITGSQLLSLTTFEGSLYVGGVFTTGGGIHVTNIAAWDGSAWSSLGIGVGASTVSRVYDNGTNLLVGGGFTLAGGIIANGIASWDGAGNWDTIGTPGRLNGVQFTVRTFAGDSTNLYVGGNFSAAGQTNAKFVGHFDGTNWSPMGSGIVSGNNFIINAMAATSSNVYVGGSFSTAGGVSAANIAAWDGANWSALGSGPGGVVAAITVRPDGVYAAGAPQGVTLYGSPFFLRWDGATWNSVVNYNPDDTFFALYFNDPNIGMDAMAFDSTNIYIGGHFSITWHDPNDFSIATNCMNIMRFDGNYARIVGTGLNSNVVAMTMLGTNLYVAGLFTNAGGIAASHIAMWDGNVWSALGSGVVGNGTVDTLTTMGTNLYAGGTFTNMGGVRASRVAKWDGNVWSALGSGVSATVLALYSSGSDLYAGGSLRTAGGYQSQFLGRWNDQMSFRTPQLSNSTGFGNGQFRARVYSASGTTNVVEASSDFISWTPVYTNNTGNFDVTDAAAGNYPLRFYRARLMP